MGESSRVKNVFYILLFVDGVVLILAGVFSIIVYEKEISKLLSAKGLLIGISAFSFVSAIVMLLFGSICMKRKSKMVLVVHVMSVIVTVVFIVFITFLGINSNI